MTAQPKSVIKSYFETGDQPTQAQFADLVDSYLDVSANIPTGTVTSVAVSAGNIFNVTGSPITSAGTININVSAQTARKFYASPVSATGVPDFRNMVLSDLPSVPALSFVANTTTSAAVPTTVSLTSAKLVGTNENGSALTAINIATPGLSLSGNTLSGITTGAQTAIVSQTSAVTTVDFTTYSSYRVYLLNMVGSAALTLEGSQDAGSSILNSSYKMNSLNNTSGAAFTSAISLSLATTMEIAIIDIVQPSITSTTYCYTNAGQGATTLYGSTTFNSTAALNRLRFQTGSTFSGTMITIPMVAR